MTIYDRIKMLREAQGLSQQELAIRLGYKSRSAINKIELGLRDISQSKVEAFAKALNTTPAYLMGWEDNVPSQNRNQLEKEFLSLFEQLTVDEKNIIVDTIKSIINRKNSDC